MTEYLVILNNETDSFEVFGYSYMDEEEVKDFKKRLNKIHEEIIITIGDSSHELVYEDGISCLESLDFIKIKENDSDILRRYLSEDNNCTITPRSIFEYISEYYYEGDESDYFEEEEDY